MTLGYARSTRCSPTCDRYGFSGAQLGVIARGRFAARLLRAAVPPVRPTVAAARLMISGDLRGCAGDGGARSPPSSLGVRRRASCSVSGAVRSARDPAHRHHARSDDVGTNLGRLASFDVAGFVLGRSSPRSRRALRHPRPF
jgi:hypothetical protein